MTDWEEKFRGSIWQVSQQQRSDGRVFELAKRTAGVRVLLTKDGKILLNREKRHELGLQSDLRLPGGKVYDDISEWIADYKDADKIESRAYKAAAQEMHEECGILIKPKDLMLIKKDVNGGKGEWDLYYFYCEVFTVDPDGPSHDQHEASEIEGWQWFDKKAALAEALDVAVGMSESRSARYVASWASGKL